MRVKVVPPVRTVEFLREVQSALPLVPGSVEDCCTRVVSRTDVAARDDAREWLTFARALGLVTESERGYARTREEPARETLAERFSERVHLADDVLAALADDPRDASAVFERVRDDVPEWERARHDDWEAVWRERVERLLDWSVEFGLAERVDGGYRRA